MVAGVDGEAEEAVLFGGFVMRNDGSKEGVGGDGGGVGDGYGTASRVIYRHWDEMLDEGSSAPDVEGLGSEADGEDGFVEVVGVLDEEFVDVFPGGVGGGALGDGVLAVFVGVDVGRAAGEEDGLAGVDEVGCLAGRGGEGDCYGFSAGTLDGLGILGPGALVVDGVGAGGDGDGYARFHKAGSRE